MSQAFVRENDDNGLLHQVEPTVPALIKHLQAENKSSLVMVVRQETRNGLEVWVMNNRFSYFINKENNWEMLL
jgi:hypothetical protein